MSVTFVQAGGSWMGTETRRATQQQIDRYNQQKKAVADGVKKRGQAFDSSILTSLPFPKTVLHAQFLNLQATILRTTSASFD